MTSEGSTTTSKSTDESVPLELPAIVRNLKWSDQLYNNKHNNEDVDGEVGHGSLIIGVFDIDRTIYDLPLYGKIVYAIGLILFLLMFQGAYQEFMRTKDPGIIFVATIFMVTFLSIWYVLNIDRTERMYRHSLKHIAISRSCLYIDYVDKPGSNNIMIRDRIEFHDISKCELQSVYQSCNHDMKYTITIYRKSKWFSPVYIEGIIFPQIFVKVINAMMKFSEQEQKQK